MDWGSKSASLTLSAFTTPLHEASAHLGCVEADVSLQSVSIIECALVIIRLRLKCDAS